jgi:hypothetical protein
MIVVDNFFARLLVTGLPTVGRLLVGSLLAIARLRILPNFCDDCLDITNA